MTEERANITYKINVNEPNKPNEWLRNQSLYSQTV